MNIKLRTFILIILLILNIKIFGNGLNISNIQVFQATSIVSFDLKWQNSWRTPASAPNNWDAAWIFIKFRKCSDPISSTNFTPGNISATVTDHTLPASLEFTDSQGNPGVLDADLKGVMLRRSADGFYPDDPAATVNLKISNLPVAGTPVDVRVYGIEMIYIPGGSFILSDGGANSAAIDKFTTGAVGTTPAVAITINNEATTYTFSDWNFNFTVPVNYPKGFQQFYIMKYEISEGQYADFLNTLSGVYTSTYYTGVANYNSFRNRLKGPGTFPNLFTTDRPYRAQNFLSWKDITAYLDWAYLRPITELEYEKACRGPSPGGFAGNNIYAWGSNTFTQITANGISGNEDGTESVPANTNCNYITAPFTSGDGLNGSATVNQNGPVRCGIFANSSTTTAASTGGTYYGVMEMSGNLWEWAVNCSDATGRAFTRVWGDGDITTWPANWPPVSLTASAGVIVRGGSWESNNISALMEISNRRFGTAAQWATSTNWGTSYGANITYTTGATATRTSFFGGRGVR
ncbi:MAG: SUMF1/EgtB/PvdO family nonheme iron enzyme [Bacteroidota bacterium]|nr:SUMF1/EgtB/PvdO family nonheme iron enzyme [Bacteroidota bacterium]